MIFPGGMQVRVPPGFGGGSSACFFPMKNLSRLLLALAFVLPALRAATAPGFDAWADAFAAEWARTNPQFATQAQYFTGAEQDALDRQLTLVGAWGNTFGRRASAERAALARRGLEELKAFSTGTLTATQRTSAALLAWQLQNVIESAEFATHRYIFDQFTGLQIGLVNFLTQTHPIRRRRDAENYLARLALVAPRIDEGIAEARAAEEAGIRPPRFIVQRTLEQLDGFLMHAAAENVFVATFKTRLAALREPALPDTDGAALVAEATQLVDNAVLPAYRRVRDLLAAQLPKTTDDAGAWRLPRGDAFYRQALATYTTTALGADEIHAIGRREVARIEGEMDRILRELGHATGSVKERFEQVQMKLIPPTEPDPRPAVLAETVRIVQDAERRAADLFDLRPQAPVEVRREPAFSERTAAARYTLPAPDGSRPGIYWLPMAHFTPQTVWLGAGLRSTAYHEAVPGHHFQLAILQELKDVPRFRTQLVFGGISANAEGWALYAERLADENGWYEGDPTGRLGYLNAQLFRARRLVVDTGLHAKKWTRQQAIDYGISPTEVERYVAWPGQATSYMIGQLRILELREKAKAALGARFSLKEFHNVVLRAGNVPLDVLAQEIDAWTTAAAKK